MAVNANAEYVPLMAIEEHENNDVEAEGNIRHDGYKHAMSQNQRVGFLNISSITTVSVYSALAISLVAFFLSSLSFWSFGRPSASSLEIGPQALRRPSLYLGLERVPEIKVRLDAEALLRPTPDHSGSGGNGHGGMHENAGTPEVDGMVKPSTFVRISRLYPDMNWTDEKIVLSESVRVSRMSFWRLILTSNMCIAQDLMILYFPLPNNVISDPSQCTLRASFPAQSALNGRLLTVEGRSPSITLSQVTLPETFHGSALGELAWNRRPQTQLVCTL